MELPGRVAALVERLVGEPTAARVSGGTNKELTVWLDWSQRQVAREVLDADPDKVTFESPQVAHLWVDDYKVALRMDVPALQYARAAALVLLEQERDPAFTPRSGMTGVDEVIRRSRGLLKPLRFAEVLDVEPVADTLAHLICTATGVDATRPANFDAVAVTAASKRDLIATAKALHRPDPTVVRVGRPALSAEHGIVT